MEHTKKTSAKDFFINLGAIIALGVMVENVISLLFTVIDKAYPPITNYYYGGTYSISFPVASLIIFFPIYILLMWLLEREYSHAPEKRHLGVRKWLTYITLFLAGLTIAGDLVTLIYYFIDGQELTTGFILKVLSVLVVALAIFMYYIFDSLNKLNVMSRKVWAIVAVIIILGSVVWGFSVLGSPRTQQLLKYDEQKVNDLQSIDSDVRNFYESKGYIPGSLSELSANAYMSVPVDEQTGNSYEYTLIGQSAKAYKICAEFNKASISQEQQMGFIPVQGPQSWEHPAGHYCFSEAISPSLYKPVPTAK